MVKAIASPSECGVRNAECGVSARREAATIGSLPVDLATLPSRQPTPAITSSHSSHAADSSPASPTSSIGRRKQAQTQPPRRTRLAPARSASLWSSRVAAHRSPPGPMP